MRVHGGLIEAPGAKGLKRERAKDISTECRLRLRTRQAKTAPAVRRGG